MAHITRKGYELAAKLAPAIGYTNGIAETCSLICRSAVTLHRLNEESCNGHPAMSNPNTTDWARAAKLQERWETRVDAQTETVTKHLEALVWSLPEVDDFGHWTLRAEEDPRGCSLVVAPNGSDLRGDSWGDSNGFCIPR
jgi:hypothetical protein